MSSQPYQPNPYGYPPAPQPYPRPRRPAAPRSQVVFFAVILVTFISLGMISIFFFVNWYANDGEKAADAWNDVIADADELVSEIADENGDSDSETRRDLRIDSDDEDELFATYGTYGSGLFLGDGDCLKLTAWELWTGSECDDGSDYYDGYDYYYSYDEDYTGPERYAILTFREDDDELEGFGDVAAPERILIIYPILGLIMLGIGAVYFVGGFSDSATLLILAALALGALAVPLVWGMMRDADWQANLEDSPDFEIDNYSSDAADEAYTLLKAPMMAGLSTTIPIALAGVALFISIGAYVAQLFGGRGGPRPPYGGYPQQPPQAGWGPPPAQYPQQPPQQGWGQQPPAAPQQGWGQQPPSEWGPPRQ